MVHLTNLKRIGIRALYDVSHQNEQKISTTTISYLLIPRINAAGRMGDASRAVELLMTKDEAEAVRLAELLSQENVRRQEIELAIYDEAVALLENPKEGETIVHAQTGPILVCGKDWHPGVIGIVASRLVMRYNRPAIVFTEASGQTGTLKGSARASDGYNILEAIQFAQEFTLQFGGHPKAAGISVLSEQFPQFSDRLEEYEQQNKDVPNDSAIDIDACLSVEDLTLETCREIAGLAPFGEGNREPRFFIRDCRIVMSSVCGNQKHLKVKFSLTDSTGGEKIFDGICFGMGNLGELFKQGSCVDVVFGLSISSWKNRESLSMQVSDMHFTRSGKLIDDATDILEKLYENHLPIKQVAVFSKVPMGKLIPEKEDFKRVYQFLRTRCSDEITLCDESLMARFVSSDYGIELHGFALARVLDVFAEAGLLRFYSRKGQRVCFILLFVDGKVKLENTPTYQKMYSEGGSLK
jgi:single-stranded-DNA-specific exonuclease